MEQYPHRTHSTYLWMVCCLPSRQKERERKRSESFAHEDKRSIVTFNVRERFYNEVFKSYKPYKHTNGKKPLKTSGTVVLYLLS